MTDDTPVEKALKECISDLMTWDELADRVLELETKNDDLTRQLAEAREEVTTLKESLARLRKAHIELAKEHGALLETLFKIDE